MLYRYIDSPIGQLLLAGDGEGLKIIGFPHGKGKVSTGADWEPTSNCFLDAEWQLAEYFAGRRRSFDLNLAPQGTDQTIAACQQNILPAAILHQGNN